MKSVLRTLLLVVPMLVAVGSCFAEGNPVAGSASPPPEAGVAETEAPVTSVCPPNLPLRIAPDTASCRTADTAEPLPQRRIVSDKDAAKVDVTYFTDDLFASFRSYCGGCHVEDVQGDFNVSGADFRTLVDLEVLDQIRSDDPEEYMPPDGSGGKKWNERKDGDPIKEFAKLLELWISQGSPIDFFTIPADQGGVSRYFMEKKLAQSLTNLGNCIPDAELVATSQEKSCQLDQTFTTLDKMPPPAAPEEQVGLPRSLDQTDLFTFDSEELARHGVIAFAPGYPLWSDSAGKLRHVRVPLGQSIHFDKERQEFEIPDNTRFYKTFMKKVVDDAGNERWKKIETRLIVARQENPLFGTYLWNENETKADLLRDARRDGTPFRDRTIIVVTDEPKAAEVRAEQPRNLTFALEEAGVIRRYGIPGSERCIQCHMGSPSSSFILGFTPMQILRRPKGENGEGGVIEPSGADELNQLQRLIDYGVITGMDSPTDVVLLEDSQLPRKPRNQYELLAQGYMFGNCAHCHNSRGFPSKELPEIAPLLDFWPSAEGGIFEFPLEAHSPRLKRGVEGDLPIPYITPSLYDRIPSNPQKWARKHTVNYASLVVPVLGEPDPITGVRPITGYDDDDFRSNGSVTIDLIEAPWRSLIWRNVDTPFPYGEDYAIYPHMPMNTPGFDCRAPRILGDWMVSIPSVRKNPATWEPSIPQAGKPDMPLNVFPGPPDNEPQPYVEVQLGEAGYDAAVAAAQTRLEKWHAGARYNFCPDTSDIVDRKVLRRDKIPGGDRLVPVDGEIFALEGLIQYDSVPDRPHWIETDLTELPPPWYPRRADWAAVLEDGKFPMLDPLAIDYQVKQAKRDEEMKVVDVLRGTTISQAFETFALAELPLALWEKKPGCDFSDVPKVAEFVGADGPAWLQQREPAAPVFMSAPGETIFDMICANCHGVNADSRGIQAQKVAELTGGNTRVANFMTGLFGPPGDPEGNRERIFGVDGRDSALWAPRYLGWMALGGTQRQIPLEVLEAVGKAEVAGMPRKKISITASPNMLAVAEQICRWVLPFRESTGSSIRFNALKMNYDDTPLIGANGDAELWERLCTLDNARFVRAVKAIKWLETGTTNPLPPNAIQLELPNLATYSASDYPANSPVGNAKGGVDSSLNADSMLPWCIVKPATPAEIAAAEAFVLERAVAGVPLPFCPDALINAGPMTILEMKDWAKRGALNAGFAVYLFLNELAHGRVSRVRYNECEKLAN